MSLLGKARARPDQVRKLLDSVSQQGAVATYQKAMNRLDSYTPLGYSLCGVVVEVGAGAEQFSVGQVVAAAGNEFALHAEVNWVPVNLCVPVPAGVAPEHAAFATVGAIAMQGVRRAEVALGETACVIGLGLIGQLVVRLLVAVRRPGGGSRHRRGSVPRRREGRCARLRRPRRRGRGAARRPSARAHRRPRRRPRASWRRAATRTVRSRWRHGWPATVHASSTSARPSSTCRGTPITTRSSTSGSPGRTAPVATTTATSSRASTTRRATSAGRSAATWRASSTCSPRARSTSPRSSRASTPSARPSRSTTSWRRASCRASGSCCPTGPMTTRGRRAPRPDDHDDTGSRAAATAAPPATGALRVGFVGAGNYAASMLLPHLREDARVELVSVATTTSLSGMNAQRKFGFRTITTDVDAVLDDESLDAVFVVTRHDSHAGLVCRALERGHAVFVEKPLALSEEQLAGILAVVEATGNDRLMVGFNRRFAPLVTELGARMACGRPATAPVAARYLVNAGRLAAGSWYLNEELAGSRFTGEGGHFIDTLSALVGADPVEVHAAGTGPDVHLTLRYGDGSVGAISYVTSGSPRFPKETVDVTAGGRTGVLENFRRVTVWSGKDKTVKRALGGQDKGQRAQLARFVEAVRSGAPMPIPLASLAATTRATLAAGTSLSTKRPWRCEHCDPRLVRAAPPAHVARRGGLQGRRRGTAPPVGPATGAARCRTAPGVGPPARQDVPRCPARGRTGGGSRRGRGGRRGGGRPGAPRCLDRLRRPARGQRRARLVPRPRHRAAGSRHALRVRRQPPRRGVDGERQAGVGDVPPPPPDRARGRVVAHGGGPLRPRRSPTSCGRGGASTPTSPACTGPAGSRRASGCCPGCGSVACSTTGPRPVTSSRTTPTPCARSAGTRSTSPRSSVAARRPTTTSWPRPRGGWLLPAPSPGSRNPRAGAVTPPTCWSASSRRTPSRAGSTASWPATTTASSSSSRSWPRSRRTSPARRCRTAPGN